MEVLEIIFPLGHMVSDLLTTLTKITHYNGCEVHIIKPKVRVCVGQPSACLINLWAQDPGHIRVLSGHHGLQGGQAASWKLLNKNNHIHLLVNICFGIRHALMIFFHTKKDE